MKKYFLLLVVYAFVAIKAFSQGVIVNSDPLMNDRFSKKLGNLWLSTSLLKIGKIKNNGSKTDTVRIYNGGMRNMSLAPGKIPVHMHVTFGSWDLAPKMESWIAVSYDAVKKNDYGFVLDRFEIITNDSVQPKKIISVSAYLQEYFGVMSAEDSLNIQKARWIETSYDYGKIRQGSKVTHNFAIVNDGKRDLYIRKLRSNCNCMKMSTSSDTIAPGATVSLLVEFDSANKEGKDSRKMNVFLNDPARPEVVLEMKGEIEK
jgi:hypothetical protein